MRMRIVIVMDIYAHYRSDAALLHLHEEVPTVVVSAQICNIHLCAIEVFLKFYCG